MVKKLYKIAFFSILALLHCPASHAQTSTSSNAPLEITAEKTLEWHRNDLKYIARGKAMAKQGDTTINAETLTARYKETDKSSFDIYEMVAEENVVISSKEATATGDKAVYNVDKGLAVMTGNNLTMVSPEQTVTARDSFEYFVTEGKLTAKGNVRVIRTDDTITADTMSALFIENTKGQRELKRLEASGNVIIKTPTETLTGDTGHYNAATNIAEISGNVKITRGNNILEGERADVDLSTNVSRMFGSATQGGRVRGVFYPDSTKKTEEVKPQEEAYTPPQAQTLPPVIETPPPQPSGTGGILTAP